MTTTRLNVSGHRFVLRRLECALLGRDLDAGASIRASRQSLSAGAVIAVVLLAGCAMLAVLRPQPALSGAPIVIAEHSGALFVRLGDTVHPVLNLASARLITRTNTDPQPTPESTLAQSNRGPLLGIPGAPQFLGAPLAEDELQWAVCDTRGSTTVVVGHAEPSRALAREQAVLVRAAGGSAYLLYDGRRAVVDLRAFGLDGAVAQTVSPVLLRLIPEVGLGALDGFPVGGALRVVRTAVDAATLCVHWTHAPSAGIEISFSVGGLPIPAGYRPVTLAQADGAGPAVDAVFLAPGHLAYVRATGLSGKNPGAGTRYLIADTGVRFAVHDDAAAGDLGLPDTVIPAPWPLLSTLPDGPELSRANASVVQDLPAGRRGSP